MSYARDSERSRGVGAIAATDGRLRQKRRMMQARALRSRDRALASWTMGPSGGHAGLGMISRAGMSPGGLTLRAGSIDTPSPTWIPPTTPVLPPIMGGGGKSGPFLPATIAPPRWNTSLLPATATTGGNRAGTYGGGGLGPQSVPNGGLTQPTVMVDPLLGGSSSTPATGPLTGPASTSGGAVTGGGGGGIVTGGSTPPDLTPPTDVPDVPAGTGMSTTTKLLIAAGALGALYLLTKKKGG